MGLNDKYIRPFNTKDELLKAYGYKDIDKIERAYIKGMNDKKFEKCLNEATLGDCFDVGYFTYIIHK